MSDNTTEKIFRFDNHGGFLNSISPRGGGPEEHVTLGDFILFNGNLYIQDKDRNRILVYKTNGEFIKQLKLETEFVFDEFTSVHNRLFLVTNYRYSDIGNYSLYEVDLMYGGASTSSFFYIKRGGFKA